MTEAKDFTSCLKAGQCFKYGQCKGILTVETKHRCQK